MVGQVYHVPHSVPDRSWGPFFAVFIGDRFILHSIILHNADRTQCEADMTGMRLPKPLLLFATSLVTAPLIAVMFSLATREELPDFEALCDTGQPFYAVSSYRAQRGTNQQPGPGSASIIVFQDTKDETAHYELATFQQTGAVWGLAYHAGQHAVFASTYHKRGLPYGPEGPGGIYRIDLATDAVTTFAVVPNAGSRQRAGTFTNGSFEHDSGTARNVGKVALGDLDLNDDGTELFVVNLNDRLIYRYDVATGALIGSFPHGGRCRRNCRRHARVGTRRSAGHRRGRRQPGRQGHRHRQGVPGRRRRAHCMCAFVR